ncbi:MAG: hypothetical protein LBL38_03040, partial [Lactobacillales bacterium]|nr:hypothetical protein [Lactobacillales bacterium]
EKKHIELNDNNYDEIEKIMLTEFYHFLRSNTLATFVHWNMRDTNYGFSAIEHRLQVLSGSPYIIPDSSKFDLSQALIEIYGENYIGHPRLEKIIDKNNITKKSFLSGVNEAEAFEKKEYVKLEQSTLRKVDALETIFCLAAENRLKSNFKLIRFTKPLYFFVESFCNNLYVTIITLIAAILAILQFFYNFNN